MHHRYMHHTYTQLSGEPNQNSKTTFIVQTFPKYGPYDFYFVNLSLLGAILAIFQFCGFSGLFWPFSLVNRVQFSNADAGA